jgi:hypothetical protein
MKGYAERFKGYRLLGIQRKHSTFSQLKLDLHYFIALDFPQNVLQNGIKVYCTSGIVAKEVL